MAALLITERTSDPLAAFQRVASTPITPIAYNPVISIPADIAAKTRSVHTDTEAAQILRLEKHAFVRSFEIRHDQGQRSLTHCPISDDPLHLANAIEIPEPLACEVVSNASLLMPPGYRLVE